MKASEIRDKEPDEIVKNISELREALFNLRFQHEIGQLENPKKMAETKRDIARLKTILREKR